MDEGKLCIRVGMEFDSAVAARHHIEDYALQNLKAIKSSRANGGHNRRIVCTSSGCTFYVQLYKRHFKDAYCPWYVSSCELQHTNCVSTPKPTARQVGRLAAITAAATAPNVPPAKSLVHQAQLLHKINLDNSIHTVYRVRTDIRAAMHGDVVTGYQRLPSFMQRFNELNPGGVACAEYDDSGIFSRAILVPPVTAKASHSNQLVCAVDGGHMKGEHFDGVQLLLIGRDGNFANVTLAVALVNKENKDNYKWFFGHCAAAGIKLDVPVFGDRAEALLAGAKASGIQLVHCTIHIMRNLYDNFKGHFTKKHEELVWTLQGSVTEELFKDMLKIVGLVLSDAVAEYLGKIEPDMWVLYPNLMTRPLYGWRSSNFVESEMAASKKTGLRSLTRSRTSTRWRARRWTTCTSAPSRPRSGCSWDSR